MKKLELTEGDLVYANALVIALRDETLVFKDLAMDDLNHAASLCNWAKGLSSRMQAANVEAIPKAPQKLKKIPKASK